MRPSIDRDTTWGESPLTSLVNRPLISLIAGVPIVAAVVWLLLYYVSVALIRYPDFDGALNLNVARSLLDGTGYRSFYNEWVSFFPETNAPYIFPAVAAVALFGVTPFGTQIVNLLYIVAFAVLVFVLVTRLSKPLVGLIAVFVTLQAPGLYWFGMNGYGEVAALCFMFGACMAFRAALESDNHRFVFVGGVLLALSFLTKTVALIWSATVIVGFLVARPRDCRGRDLLRLILAILVPVLVWELYRLATLHDIHNYTSWWHAKIAEILDRAGPHTRLHDTTGRWNKAQTHLNLLDDWLGSPSIWLTLLFLGGLTLASIVVMRRMRGDVGGRFVFWSIAATGAIYLVWWVMLAPTQEAWLRRIMNGLILTEIATILSIYYLVRGKRSPANVATAIALAAALVVVVIHNHLLWNRPDDRPQSASNRELFERVSALPADARLYGVGWYQSPVVALVTGRRFYDFERNSASSINAVPSERFIVIEQVALYQPGFVVSFIKRCLCELMFANGGGRIYRIKGAQDDSYDVAAQTVVISSDTGLFEAGFFADDGGMRWSAQRAQMRLPVPDFGQLLLTLHVPALAQMTSAPAPSVLEIYRGSCLVTRRELSPGDNQLLISNACHDQSFGNALEFRLNGHVRPETVVPDTRALAWLFRGMELMSSASMRPSTPSRD